MYKILDGKALSLEIYENAKKNIAIKKLTPRLDVVLVGEDPASIAYIRQKRKACEKVGITFKLHNYDSISEELLLNKISELNNNKEVTGILVQLPLPKTINVEKIVNHISPQKDVDGFHLENVGKLMVGHSEKFLVSCAAQGVITLLDKYKVDVKGKNVVVIGTSNLVGKPISILLMNRKATVTNCGRHTKDLSKFTKNADIIISAVGKPMLVTKEMVKENAVIIDIGITRVNNKLVGDVDFENVKDKCSLITPVPGGVGPMTVATLIQNIITAYLMQY
jgi:methylenetetrahydrofolate dehydrogenase (NADP+) / methenyltetrahydrofolate cyclohydrolase